MEPRQKQIGWLALRLGMSVVLILILFRQIAVGEVFSTLGRSLHHWRILLVTIILPGFGLLAASYRWRVLLLGQGIRVSLMDLNVSLLVAAFFNQIFPSTIGGDVVRSQRVAVSTRSSTAGAPLVSMTVVALDRAIGVVGIGLLAVVAATIDPSVIKQVPEFWLLIGFIGAGVLTIILLSTGAMRRAGDKAFSSGILKRLRDKVRLVYDAIMIYRHDKSRLFIALFWSVVIQALIVMQYKLLALVLDVKISLWQLGVIIPIVTLVSLLPITINGIGLREGALAVLGASVGLGVAEAIALAWLVVGFRMLYVLAGGVVYLVEQRSAFANLQA